MTADRNGYTVGECADSVRRRTFKPGARYYTTLAQAVSSTAELALRDRIAAGQIGTLTAAVDELQRIKAEIIAVVDDCPKS